MALHHLYQLFWNRQQFIWHHLRLLAGPPSPLCHAFQIMGWNGTLSAGRNSVASAAKTKIHHGGWAAHYPVRGRCTATRWRLARVKCLRWKDFNGTFTGAGENCQNGQKRLSVGKKRISRLPLMSSKSQPSYREKYTRLTMRTHTWTQTHIRAHRHTQ